jgi:hypothetical protein
MNGMAKHDVLWRLTITDKRDTSGVALLAKSCKLLEKGAEYGIASPTDAQLAALGNPNAHLWFRFHIDVTREDIHREEGGKAVLTAAERGDVPKLRKLLWAMVNIDDARAGSQWTALMLAAMNGHAECTQMLIKAGSDVTATDLLQYTALMYAAAKGHAKCTQMLIKAGSDVTAKDAWGQTAMDIAKSNGGVRQPCVALLKEAMSQAKAQWEAKAKAKAEAEEKAAAAAAEAEIGARPEAGARRVAEEKRRAEEEEVEETGQINCSDCRIS